MSDLQHERTVELEDAIFNKDMEIIRLKDRIDELEAALAAAEAAGWEPIENIPKERGREMMLTDGREIAIGWWGGDKWYFNYGKPTHARPLPEPPAG